MSGISRGRFWLRARRLLGTTAVACVLGATSARAHSIERHPDSDDVTPPATAHSAAEWHWAMWRPGHAWHHLRHGKNVHGQVVTQPHAPLTMHTEAGACTCGIHLAGHQMTWSLHTKIPRGFKLQAINGLLPDNWVVDYLRWRRSLNPARFDHWHPRVGPMLALDERIRASLACPPPTLGQVVTTTSTPHPHVHVPGAPLPPNPPSAPEPSTALLGMVLVGAGGWLRRRALVRTES